MRRLKTYAWLNPDMKKCLKMMALEKDKTLLDLRPLDIGFEREENNNNSKRWRFRI